MGEQFRIPAHDRALKVRNRKSRKHPTGTRIIAGRELPVVAAQPGATASVLLRFLEGHRILLEGPEVGSDGVTESEGLHAWLEHVTVEHIRKTS